ncbi:acyl-ACP thioesterase [Rhizomicrobium palustre]|uniref:Acyl-ACP thioesterase n=1 Tax=Rhizomicrobium palustre TaxID=189966 RepID=A0A846MUD0_9PROT|nr:acyl-ACP thioesterase domain-containing protein [Rhizomicrobium palustre]NIK86690.1 acyl-ACP thioesterase [Rhizomicrobium palustre]
MDSAIWVQHYDVNTMVLDHHKRLSLVGLLNMLQDTAWIHAKHRGWGFEDLIAKGTIWVLARQKLVMQAWPMWEDRITLHTWGRAGGSVMALREFEIFSGDKKIGESTTSWLVLDYETRKPQKLDRVSFNLMCREEGNLAIAAERLTPRSDLVLAAEFDVRHSDLDVNGHVNNTRYAAWLTDTMSSGDLAGFDITEYDVNFLAETSLGDRILIESEDGARGEDGCITRAYQGRKAGADKPAFVQRVVLRPR